MNQPKSKYQHCQPTMAKLERRTCTMKDIAQVEGLKTDSKWEARVERIGDVYNVAIVERGNAKITFFKTYNNVLEALDSYVDAIDRLTKQLYAETGAT